MSQIIHHSFNKSAPTPAEVAMIRSFPPAFTAMQSLMQPDGMLAPGTAITPAQRQEMQDLANRLQEISSDHRPKDLNKALTFLLTAFPGQSLGPEASRMMLMAYEMAMEGCPTWAVEEAARRWLMGICGAQRFAPSPPELRCAADDVVRITKGKAASLRWLSKAEVATLPTAEDNARYQQILGQLGASLKRMPKDPADLTEAERASELEALEALKGAPLEGEAGVLVTEKETLP